MKRLIVLFTFTALAVAISPTSFFAQSQSDTEVFITNTGERYHKETCQHLSKSKIKTTFEKAKELDYTPCKVCKPVGYHEAVKNNSYNTGKSPSTATRCTGTTKSGARCKRMTKNSSGRCYQH